MFPTASTRRARAGRKHDRAVELLDHARARRARRRRRAPFRSRTRVRDPAVTVEVHLAARAPGSGSLGSAPRARIEREVGLLARVRAPPRAASRSRPGSRDGSSGTGAGARRGRPRRRRRSPPRVELGDRHRDRVELPDVAEVDRSARPRSRSRSTPWRVEAADDALLHLAVDARRISARSTSSWRRTYAHEKSSSGSTKSRPDRARHAREGRHDHLGHLQLAREVDRVQRPGAAEGDEAELARVEAALDGHEADRLDHVRVRDPQHALGRVLERSGRAARRSGAAGRSRRAARRRAACGRRGRGRC